MTCDHRHCNPSRYYGFLGTLLASAALGASITYLLFGSQNSVARTDQSFKHDALSQDVSVDAKLVKAEQGWSIQLGATNKAATDRRCSIAASLTRTQSSMMSRSVPMPRIVWSETIEVTVPARGQSPARLAIPAKIAKDIADPKTPPSPMETRDYYGVQVQATCGAGRDNQVG
jgi:hypothetical protein